MRIHMNIPRPVPFALLVTVCFLSSSGCGGGTEKIVSVFGKVTHNGQPVPGIIVSFVPQAQTTTGVSTGETDDNGKYELTVVKTRRSGAVVGTHKVWVSIPRPSIDVVDKAIVDREDKKMSTKKKGTPGSEKPSVDLAAILKKYGNLDKTPLTMEVKGGEPIDLKLD